MTAEFGGIHALNAGDAIAEISGMGNQQFVFEHISSPAEPADKEIGAGVLGAFIIAQAILIFVLTDHVHGFHTGSPKIFHMQVLHIAIAFQFNAHFYFIAHVQHSPIGQRYQYRTGI